MYISDRLSTSPIYTGLLHMIVDGNPLFEIAKYKPIVKPTVYIRW